MNEPRLGILIPNWNGAAYVERCLGSVMAAVRHLGRPCEVVVVDDASEDESPAMIERGFASVRLIRRAANGGFGEAVNEGMRAMDADLVFLLNNDLALRVDMLERLLQTRAEAEAAGPVFAVGARTLDWTTQAPNHGGQSATWAHGLIVQRAFEAESPAPTDFFQAGACLIDRTRFLHLGGFEPLFSPGYWEDYDLALQARRHGWGVIYDPGAVAYHCGKGSMRRRFGGWGVSLLLKRNHLIFTWVNALESGPMLRHWPALALRALREQHGRDEAGWGRAMLAALPRLPRALRVRRHRRMEIPRIAGRNDA